MRAARPLLLLCLSWLAGLAAVCGWLGAPRFSGRAVLYPRVAPSDLAERARTGDAIDMWRRVPVRHNGRPYWRSQGRHLSPEGYYYGKRWQCVEFVKRFYFDAFGHRMPDVMGDARDFFDETVPQGAWNARRGMFQFRNGGGEPPAPEDLMVWHGSRFGHVAVVSRVEGGWVEVVQQNVASGSRARLTLIPFKNGWRVGDAGGPAGWLRLPGRPVRGEEGH